MTENTIETENDVQAPQDAPDEMTEQIDASFGPMNVYVSGTDADEVLESFNEVWDQMLETSDQMHERQKDMDDGSKQDGPGRSFSD